MNPEFELDKSALRLLRAIYEKTKGRSRACRDVTELESGLTSEQARAAWRYLLGRELIERFSQDYAARLSVSGLEFIQNAPVPEPLIPQTPPPTLARKVLIVRGPDSGTREAVAKLVEKIGLQAVLVHEDTADTPKIMQQVESVGEVAYIVVLLTRDDLARIEVLMEMGYFIGRFGRVRICAFAMGSGAELPADLAGVALQSFDDEGNWRSALSRGLLAAGVT
jgi:hypothetical protein